MLNGQVFLAHKNQNQGGGRPLNKLFSGCLVVWSIPSCLVVFGSHTMLKDYAEGIRRRRGGWGRSPHPSPDTQPARPTPGGAKED